MSRARRYRLTGSALSSRVGQWTQPGIVRSLQSGSIAIGGGSASQAFTITTVDPNNTVVLTGGAGVNDATTNADRCFCRVTLTNATTVTATRGSAASGGQATVNFTAIEFWPGAVRSVQYGTIAIGAGLASGTATITAVNTTRAGVECLGFSTTNTGAPQGQMLARVTLTNATTVTTLIDAANDITTVGFVVVEWY